MRGGHAQTLASHFLSRENHLPEPEERLFRVEEESQVLCHCHWQAERRERKTLVIVHGLEGSSKSQYVIGNGSKAWQAGYNVVRMNVRNCGETEHLSPTLYHSGLSGDVGAVVRALIEQDGLRRVAVLGYSMGGNQVLKLAGEWGREAPAEVFAVAAVSPGLDLAAGADALHEAANRIYELQFLVSLKARIRKKARLFPERYQLPAMWRIWTLRAFDDAITAPAWGFRDADDYYDRASAAHVVERISVPTLVIHALDDPFVRITPATRAKLTGNLNVTYLEEEHGGHCGFLEDVTADYDGRWAEKQVLEFLEAH
jgi:predicted alpha/beta-fold hydrolase